MSNGYIVRGCSKKSGILITDTIILCFEEGFPHISAHILRHTACTRLTESGEEESSTGKYEDWVEKRLLPCGIKYYMVAGVFVKGTKHYFAKVLIPKESLFYQLFIKNSYNFSTHTLRVLVKSAMLYSDKKKRSMPAEGIRADDKKGENIR